MVVQCNNLQLDKKRIPVSDLPSEYLIAYTVFLSEKC